MNILEIIMKFGNDLGTHYGACDIDIQLEPTVYKKLSDEFISLKHYDKDKDGIKLYGWHCGIITIKEKQQ